MGIDSAKMGSRSLVEVKLLEKLTGTVVQTISENNLLPSPPFYAHMGDALFGNYLRLYCGFIMTLAISLAI